ncbi:MAG: carboxy terminal-processing peptidase [Simkaniaceae bacterium]
MNEILKAHVTYKELSDEVIRRSLENYLENLDPLKIYLLENEVIKWSEPSDELISKVKEEMQKENFSTFQEIYDTMVKAIQRRNKLESTLLTLPKALNVKQEEFKEPLWVKTEEELLDRLVRLRTLQAEAAEKLEEDAKNQFFQRLTKRRLSKEQEILGETKDERQKQMLATVLKAFSSALDSYTSYFTPSEAQQFMIQVQQRLFGIGAQLRDDLNGFTIVRILEGGPAEKNGEIKIGDRIIAVDGEPVVGLDIIEAVELIRGPKGTSVKLTLLREKSEETNNPGKKFDLDIIRDEIVLNESRFETSLQPFGDGVIAHLRLFSFYQDPNSSSSEDLKNEILKLKEQQNLLGVILDLRSNPGGLLPQAIAVTGLFIKKGIVASIKGTNEKIHHLRNFDGERVWDGPLIVLINRASASASEIVAQTLQDYGRALIVGDDHTFGKGSYQTFTLETSISQNVKINPQGEYKVTRGRYYTVSGKSPQLTGTKSDIEVPGSLSKMEIGEKFAKYPLENDKIEPHFNDDLSDIHPFHRNKLRRMYLTELQQPVFLYQPYLNRLRENSKKRLELSTNYQYFLQELAKKESLDEEVLPFGQNDLQLEETFSIMKDLILMNKHAAQPQLAG